MQLRMWPSQKTRIVQCRRGSKVFRVQEVEPNTNQVEYAALTLAVIELLEDGKVVGTVETHSNANQPRQIEPTKEKVDEAFKAEQKSKQLTEDDKRPSDDKREESSDDSKFSRAEQAIKSYQASRDKLMKEKVDEQFEARKQPEAADGARAPKKDDDNVLKVGAASGDPGRTFSGAVSVQVSPMDKGDARLRRGYKRGNESGSDGVYSDAPDPKPIYNRREEGVGSVPPSDKDA